MFGRKKSKNSNPFSKELAKATLDTFLDSFESYSKGEINSEAISDAFDNPDIRSLLTTDFVKSAVWSSGTVVYITAKGATKTVKAMIHPVESFNKGVDEGKGLLKKKFIDEPKQVITMLRGYLEK